MGKSDQQKTQANLTEKHDQDNNTTNTGIADTQSRMAALTPQAANQKNDIWSGYSNLANSTGVDKAASDRLLSGNYSEFGAPSPSSGASSGGPSGATAAGAPSQSYTDVYNELASKNGGFDPSRLGRVDAASHTLANTRGNYGDVNSNIDKLSHAEDNYGATNSSISGLQGFAKTGGLDANQLGNINRESLQGLERTGGYSDADIANERARGNSGIAATYGNLKDNLTKSRLASGGQGPGWSQAGFKLARQGAQDTASQAQKTEADIHERVNANKMQAGTALGSLGLGTAGLQSQNTLTGYKSAGDLDIGKNTAIQDAWNSAGKLGLGRESQIDAATRSGADVDTNAQGLINQTRLGAAGGLSQDALGRASIGAQSGAMSAALQSENQRFLIDQASRNRAEGLGGMLNTYSASPTDLQFNQNLLRGYGQDQANNSNNLIQGRVAASQIPGLGSTISSGLGIGAQIAGMASSGLGGFGGLFKPKVPGMTGQTLPMGAG